MEIKEMKEMNRVPDMFGSMSCRYLSICFCCLLVVVVDSSSSPIRFSVRLLLPSPPRRRHQLVIFSRQILRLSSPPLPCWISDNECMQISSGVWSGVSRLEKEDSRFLRMLELDGMASGTQICNVQAAIWFG
ncbi:hypothetical protein ACLOJK_025081 [Asimina triloba]